MIRRITELSAKMAAESSDDPEALERRFQAAKGQSPRFLLLSPIHRSAQDLQVFRFGQGDAFHATRVTEQILPLPKNSPFLFAGPAAYNRQFPEKSGVIITFDLEEPGAVVRESIQHAAEHPDFKELPISAFRVDYEGASVRLIAHGFDRDYELENYVLKRVSKPDYLDDDTLAVLCSDSRVRPPLTPNGLPMAIQTLGAYLPAYNETLEETVQLNQFFGNWLSKESIERRIIVVVHGNFEGEGPPCGAAQASLSVEDIREDYLRRVIKVIDADARHAEENLAGTPEERAVTIGKVSLANLRTYPAVADAIKKGVLHEDFMRVLKMDTVTNVVSPYELEPL